MGGGFSERQLPSIPPHLMTPRFLGAMLLGYWTYWYPIGKSLSSQSERSFKIPKQSIVIEPNQGKKKPRRELFCNQGPQKRTNDKPVFPINEGLGHTNHHVDVFWFQAIEELPPQADSFKVHKHSSKNFKSVLRNHLK